jgi:hypothetical protein
VSTYGDFKAGGKIPGLLSEEVKVSFTVCINWLNYARLVSYTHSFWYLEVKDLKLSASTRASWHSGLFLWTFPLSKEWACLFLRHGLLEASPSNTSDSFFLSKIYIKSTRVTFKRIYLFDVYTHCLRVQTRLVISRAG